jgi:site-specific DNA-adenine methylase
MLKAPFPYAGGKSRIAREVWRRFGDTPNYCEPFFGSGAVLLGRPPFDGNRIETVNDIDAHLSNFWRALQADPDAVAYHANWPVSELDLHARGDWLYYRADARAWVERLRNDPDFYDAKSAGWWVWFASCWIGGLPAVPENGQYGQGGGPDGVYARLPPLGDGGKGVARQVPFLGGATNTTGQGVTSANAGSVTRQRPHLGSGGQGNGVHQVSRQLPHVGNAGPGVARQLPAIGDAGRGTARVNGDGGPRRAMLTAYLRQLAARLERVRVCCGDWTRVLGPSVTYKHGLSSVFLDPPYSHAEREKQLYSHDNDVSAVVREWAIANGDNPLLRIALCGYDTEHGDAMPDTWSVYRWKAAGGYGSQGKGRGRTNSGRECVWFSPACINPLEHLPLFSSNGIRNVNPNDNSHELDR